MSKASKLLSLVPLVASGLFSDWTMSQFFAMLFGGMIFWIPYWIAWYLSDGFAAILHGEWTAGSGFYRGMGPDGFGTYVGSHRIGG